MNYLLDSDTVSELYDKFSAGYHKISQHLSTLTDTDQVYLSILTLYELEYGWANAPDEKKDVLRQKITELQKDFTALPLSAEGAKVFGELKKIIKDSRLPSKENMKKYNVDLMMAATAMTANCTLVSADSLYSELQRVKGILQLDNWTL
jgi:predicted nucleic acid-binding protein